MRLFESRFKAGKKKYLDLLRSKKVPKSIPEKEEYLDIEFPEIDFPISKLIYSNNITEIEVNRCLKYMENSDCGGSDWTNKGELNFPGPFYTGETDSCGTGICESPNNVILDEYAMEHVIIQPRNKKELLEIWDAAAVEVFGSYYCDGNKFWTVELVKNWWKNRFGIIKRLNNYELINLNEGQEKIYLSYLKNEAEIDLRKYCFFLDNGYYPSNEKLPELT